MLGKSFWKKDTWKAEERKSSSIFPFPSSLPKRLQQPEFSQTVLQKPRLSKWIPHWWRGSQFLCPPLLPPSWATRQESGWKDYESYTECRLFTLLYLNISPDMILLAKLLCLATQSLSHAFLDTNSPKLGNLLQCT